MSIIIQLLLKNFIIGSKKDLPDKICAQKIAVAGDSKGFGVLAIGTKENLQPLQR